MKNEGLLLKTKGYDAHESEGIEHLITWNQFKEEVKKVGYLAAPMIMVTLIQNLLRVISMMMVGHIDELAFSSASIATSLAGVTGFNLFLGMASALETLCGQAYGAKQYQKLGIHTYSAIISLFLVSLPLSLMWVNMGKLLTLIGQDPLISIEAGKYATFLIPALFAYATLQALHRYLLSQNLIIIMLLSSIAVLCLHIPVCWFLVFKVGLGSIGSASAIGLSYWLNVIFLILYIKHSSSCEQTRVPISKEAFTGIKEFFRLALPSTAMVCLEYWSYELLILLSGILPNPQLESSVLSICLATTSFLYAIPYGLGAAASTRVSNELGARKPQAARIVVCVTMFLAVTEAIIVSTLLFACRYTWGYAYSNEKEIVDYVTGMTPLVSISIIMDSLLGVMSGIARGCGWQHLGAYVNLGAFYLFGIPMAVVLSFVLHIGGKGLWIGILLGAIVQTIMFSIITSCTNWQEQAIKASERVFSKEVKTDECC